MDDSDDEFPIGTVVWANLDGFPWWPGRVTQKSDVDFDKARDIAKPGQIIVQFFNDNDRFSTMDRDKLQLFLKDDFYEQRTRSKSKSLREILGAVREAWTFIEAENPAANRRASLKLCTPAQYEQDIAMGKKISSSQLTRRSSVNSDGGRLSANPSSKKRRKPVLSNAGASDADDADGSSGKLTKVSKKRKKYPEVLHIPRSMQGNSRRWERPPTSDLHIPTPKEDSRKDSPSPVKRENHRDESRSVSEKKKRPKVPKLKRRRPTGMDAELDDVRQPRTKDSSPSRRKKGAQSSATGGSRKRARHDDSDSDLDKKRDKSPVTRSLDTKNNSGSSDRHITTEGGERTKAANSHSKLKSANVKISVNSRNRGVPEARKEELHKTELSAIEDAKRSSVAAGAKRSKSDRTDDNRVNRPGGTNSDDSGNGSLDFRGRRDTKASLEVKPAKDNILDEADLPPVPRKKDKFSDGAPVPNDGDDDGEPSRKPGSSSNDNESLKDFVRRKEGSSSEISSEPPRSKQKSASASKKYDSDGSESVSKDSHKPSRRQGERSEDSGRRRVDDDNSDERGRRRVDDSDNNMSDARSPRKTGRPAFRDFSDSESNHSPVSKRRARKRTSTSDDERNRELSNDSKAESHHDEDLTASDNENSKSDDKNMNRRGTQSDDKKMNRPGTQSDDERSSAVADRDRSDRSASNNSSERSVLSDKESPKYLSRDRPWANGTDEVLYSGRDCVPEKIFLKPYAELSKDQLISLIARREVELRWCNLKLWRQGAMLRGERICQHLHDLRQQCADAFKTISRLVSFASAHSVREGIDLEDSAVKKPQSSEADLAKFRKLEDETCAAIRNLSNIYFDEKLINLDDILREMLGMVNDVKGISKRATAAVRDMTLLWADVYALANNIKTGETAEDLSAFISARKGESEEDKTPYQVRKSGKRDKTDKIVDHSRSSRSPQTSPRLKDDADEAHRKKLPKAVGGGRVVKKLELNVDEVVNTRDSPDVFKHDEGNGRRKLNNNDMEVERDKEHRNIKKEKAIIRSDIENSREVARVSSVGIGARKLKPNNAYGKSSVDEAKKIGGPQFEITDELCAINDGSDKPERGERNRGRVSDKDSENRTERTIKAEGRNRNGDRQNGDDDTGIESPNKNRERVPRDRGSGDGFGPASDGETLPQRANEDNVRPKASELSRTLDAKRTTVGTGSDTNDEREDGHDNIRDTKETGEADKKGTLSNRDETKSKRSFSATNGKIGSLLKDEKDPGFVMTKLTKDRRDRVNLLRTSLEVWRDCNGERIRSGNRKDMAFALENAVWIRSKLDDDYRRGITALQRGLQSHAIKNEKKEGGENNVDNEFSSTVKSMIDDVERRVSNAERLVNLSLELFEKGRR